MSGLLRGYAFVVRGQDVSRRGPFALAAVVLAAATLVVFALPDSLVDLIQRNGLLEGGAADWAFRLLVLVALAQAAYGGFAVLRPERLGAPSATDREKMATTVARTAAGITCLTVVYGVAAFALTGLRGGFWAFVVITICQGAWYYRAVGVIDKWLEVQPAAASSQGTDVE